MSGVFGVNALKGVLVGNIVTAGLNPAALGVKFATIPAGTYPVGAVGLPEAPASQTVVIAESFEMATTPFIHGSYTAALQQLAGKESLLIVPLPGDGMKVIARGSADAIRSLYLAASRRELERLVHDSITKVDLRNIQGGLKALNLKEIVQQLLDIGPVNLMDPLRILQSDLVPLRDPQRSIAHVNYWEAAAFAALFGWRLPTEAAWEMAPRGKRGDVWEWTQSRFSSEENLRVLRLDARRIARDPAYHGNDSGFRVARFPNNQLP